MEKIVTKMDIIKAVEDVERYKISVDRYNSSENVRKYRMAKFNLANIIDKVKLEEE